MYFGIEFTFNIVPGPGKSNDFADLKSLMQHDIFTERVGDRRKLSLHSSTRHFYS